jgi:hypothetical protein
MQVSCFPREVLAGEDLALRSKRINVPPPPINRTPSREGRLGSFTLAPPGTPDQSSASICARDLRLEGQMVTQTGIEHLRRGQMSEDVPFAEYPLRGGKLSVLPCPACLGLYTGGVKMGCIALQIFQAEGWDGCQALTDLYALLGMHPDCGLIMQVWRA